MPLALASADFLVMGLYAAAVLAIGFVVNRRQKDSDDYFLGGRKLRWWVVGVSLVATSFSSVSLIAGTGFGFSKGMGWLQLQIGDLLAILVVCAVFLPFFSGLRLTTAYEYLEKRFGVGARTLASGLFLGQTLFRAAILVYAPALAISALLGWPVEVSILVAAGAAILYSAFGGIGAVVWTDLIQMAVILFAVTMCIIIVAGDVPGGLGAVLRDAGEMDRLDVVTISADRNTSMNLLGAVVPYAVFALALFGTGQQAVQRFLSVKDLAAARRVALTGWAVGTVSLGLTLFLGACLYSWSALAPAAEGFTVAKGDQVLPLFVDWRLPAGLAGLMLAAVFAASMSSMDSAIHSMSTAFLVDFVRRFRKRALPKRAELRIARASTATIGLLAVGGALLAADTQTPLLETLVTWLGYFAGPLLGLFLLGLLSTRANERGALTGTLLSAAGVLAVVAAGGIPFVHSLWLAPLSATATYALGLAASLATGGPGEERLTGLTLFTREARRTDPA